MAADKMGMVLRHLQSALRGAGADRSDGELLDTFVRRREGAALESLVYRHAPMVWGVCRRILPHHHDAEDAFQATFLVLARKAASIRPRTAVAGWLYGVARQTARKLRAMTARRRARERQQTDMPETAITDRLPEPDLQPLLDEELSRLPDRYRAAIVLCDLEGKSRQEAALQLGCPEGTVGSRLARARLMLARRLARRGLTLSGGMLAALLSQGAAPAGVPAAVLSAAIRAVHVQETGGAAAEAVSARALTVTEGVLKAMLLAKLKSVALATTVLGTVALGAAMLAWGSAEGEGAGRPAAGASAGAEGGPVSKPVADEELMQGTWRVTRIEPGGNLKTRGPGADEQWVVEKGRIAWSGTPRDVTLRYSLRPVQDPRQIDLEIVAGVGEGTKFKGIYKLSRDTLQVCYHREGTSRPTAFAGADKQGGPLPGNPVLLTLERSPPREPKADKGKQASWLTDWPPVAPLQLEQRTEPGNLDRSEAEAKARQYLGVAAQTKLRLYSAYLTDSDFPFLRPDRRAVWLAEARDYRLPAVPGEKGAPAEGHGAFAVRRLFAALDADTGQLIEAFTAPRDPWWREVKLRGKAHEAFWREQGYLFEKPAEPPPHSLARALRRVQGEDGQAQVEVRYVLYSDKNRWLEGWAVPVVRRPAFVVFREGLHIQPHGPAQEVVGRSVVVIDAASGELLFSQSYGDPPKNEVMNLDFHKKVPPSELQVELIPAGRVSRTKQGLVLRVKIRNTSGHEIKTTLAHEWHGGEWPPTALYASATPVKDRDSRPFTPVYLAGEDQEAPRALTLAAGKSKEVDLRMDWPGTGSVIAVPLIKGLGKYVVRFVLVFEAAGKEQYVATAPRVVERLKE